MSLCSPCKAGSAWLCSEPVGWSEGLQHMGTFRGRGFPWSAPLGKAGDHWRGSPRSSSMQGAGHREGCSGEQGAGSPQPGGSTQRARESSSSSKWLKSIALLTRLQVSDCSSLIQSDRIDVPPLPIDAVKESPRLPSYSDSPECPCRAGSLIPPRTFWRCCNKPTQSPRAPGLPLPSCLPGADRGGIAVRGASAPIAETRKTPIFARSP